MVLLQRGCGVLPVGRVWTNYLEAEWTSGCRALALNRSRVGLIGFKTLVDPAGPGTKMCASLLFGIKISIFGYLDP